jgi:hypothetical protein
MGHILYELIRDCSVAYSGCLEGLSGVTPSVSTGGRGPVLFEYLICPSARKLKHIQLVFLTHKAFKVHERITFSLNIIMRS